jgi:hypothetical protein
VRKGLLGAITAAAIGFAAVAAHIAAPGITGKAIRDIKAVAGFGQSPSENARQSDIFAAGMDEFDLGALLTDTTAVDSAPTAPEPSLVRTPSHESASATQRGADVGRSNDGAAAAVYRDEYAAPEKIQSPDDSTTPPAEQMLAASAVVNNAADDGQPSPTAKAVRTGWLSVTSEPPCEIYVDGFYVGDSPESRIQLDRGEHTLECRRPRYETYREVLNITTGELSTRRIYLQKIVGRINLSTIDGAEVFVDGNLVGVTPLSGPIELEAGSHQITVKKAGFHVWNNHVTLDPKQLLPLKITLSPIY